MANPKRGNHELSFVRSTKNSMVLSDTDGQGQQGHCFGEEIVLTGTKIALFFFFLKEKKQRSVLQSEGD